MGSNVRVLLRRQPAVLIRSPCSVAVSIQGLSLGEGGPSSVKSSCAKSSEEEESGGGGGGERASER